MPWTYGIHPVESLLTGSPDAVQEIWMVRSDRPGVARRRVQELADAKQVRVRMVTDAQIRAAVGEVTHQGVAARVQEYVYADEQSLLEAPGPGVIVLLDEVQDPQNLGSVIRSACAMGARGVVIPKHRAAQVTPAVRKVAAGAAAALPVARVTNLTRWLEEARTHGWWSYGAVVDGGAAVGHATLADRAILVMGSEGRGIRPLVLRACDQQLTLRMRGLESLNVGVATGVLLYEWDRQHRADDPGVVVGERTRELSPDDGEAEEDAVGPEDPVAVSIAEPLGGPDLSRAPAGGKQGGPRQTGTPPTGRGGGAWRNGSRR